MRSRRVTAFSLEGLPRLPRVSLPATRALARTRSGLPEEIAVPIKRLGLVAVQASRLHFAGLEEAPGISFSLEVQGQRGRLSVELSLALRLVSAVLGLPPPLTVRALGRAERGTLAAVVAAFLEAVRAPGIRVALEDGGPPEPPAVALELRVTASHLSGMARLDLPAALLAALPARPLLADPRLLNPLMVVELGRTTLEAAVYAAAEVGDAVVFEGTSPVLPDAPWPVQIRFGASCAGQLHPDGALRRQGPLVRQESETTMSSDDANITAPMPTMPLSEDAARALATAPVEIVAEVGRLTVRGDELVGLIAGWVLALGPRRPAQVVLRVGGRVWANGELVAIDDELAVRITALVK
jgi:type III secretion system YscQ/HrcQ family protein